MADQQPHKHHYIPCFYTKRWTGSDGRLCEYSRPYKDVIGRRKHPKSVGYKDDLYTLIDSSGSPDMELETDLFSPVDHKASVAIDYMISRPVARMSATLRSAFTRLILSFIHRTPDALSALIERFAGEVETRIADMQARHNSGEDIGLPPGETLEHTISHIRHQTRTRSWGSILVNQLNSKLIGNHVINMHWYIREIYSTDYTFLTGDKPLIHYNGLGQPDGNIAIPLGPRLVFLAANSDRVTENISFVPDSYLVRRVNHEIARLAVKYVYGSDDSQISFIEKRLGNINPPPTPHPHRYVRPQRQWPIL